MKKSAVGLLLLRSRQAPISMRICTRLAGAELTPLSRLSATSGATNSQGLLLIGFHGHIMRGCAAPCCSILTSGGRTGFSDLHASRFLAPRLFSPGLGLNNPGGQFCSAFRLTNLQDSGWTKETYR
ncbi:MAG: hypothetical protein WA463_17955 [Terriglobales bacterium]